MKRLKPMFLLIDHHFKNSCVYKLHASLNAVRSLVIPKLRRGNNKVAMVSGRDTYKGTVRLQLQSLQTLMHQKGKTAITSKKRALQRSINTSQIRQLRLPRRQLRQK